KGFMVRKAPDPHPFLPRSTFLAPRVTAIAGYNGQIKQFRPEQPHARCRELATSIGRARNLWRIAPFARNVLCAATDRPPARQPARSPTSQPRGEPAGPHPLAAIRWPPSAGPRPLA